MGVILNFLSNAKTSLLGFVIIGAITYCGFYVYGLKSDISDLTLDKLTLEKEKSDLQKSVAIKEAKIVILEGTVNELSGNIELQNESIKNLEVDSGKLNNTIARLQSQEPSIQYVIKSKVTNCEELQQLVKKISGLKYENF